MPLPFRLPELYACRLLAGLLTLAMLCPQTSRATELTAYAEEWPPYNFSEGNEISGISSDVLRAMCQEAKIRCTFKLVPWARAYKTAQEMPNTLVYTTARKPSREQDFLWVGPILPRTTWVYARSGLERHIEAIKDLSTYRVGVVREEAALQDLLDAGVAESALSVHPSNHDVMRMLAKSGVDAMVDTEVGMAWNLRNAGLGSKAVVRLFKLSDGGAYYFALNPHSDKDLAQRLQAALDKLRRTGKVDAIVQKYSLKTN